MSHRVTVANVAGINDVLFEWRLSIRIRIYRFFLWLLSTKQRTILWNILNILLIKTTTCSRCIWILTIISPSLSKVHASDLCSVSLSSVGFRIFIIIPFIINGIHQWFHIGNISCHRLWIGTRRRTSTLNNPRYQLPVAAQHRISWSHFSIRINRRLLLTFRTQRTIIILRKCRLTPSYLNFFHMINFLYLLFDHFQLCI